MMKTKVGGWFTIFEAAETTYFESRITHCFHFTEVDNVNKCKKGVRCEERQQPPNSGTHTKFSECLWLGCSSNMPLCFDFISFKSPHHSDYYFIQIVMLVHLFSQ